MSTEIIGTVISAPIGQSIIPAQLYCTGSQVIEDLDLPGFKDKALMDRIKSASEYISRVMGNFIPITETRKFGAKIGKADQPLSVDPVLYVAGIVNDEEAVSEYRLKGNGYDQLWENGPYTKIEQDGYWGDQDGVEISGRWGLFERSESLGISASQATNSETSLVATHGGKISAGMVLKIDDEQEYVSAGNGSKDSPAATAASSQLNGAIEDTDTEITVDNGSEFFAGEVLQIGLEELYINKISGNDLSVERGWNGTLPASHADNAAISVYRTFTVVRGVNGTTAASHSADEVYQMMVPDTVNYLARQIAGLMKMKADSGFSGITGNTEMGQGRYMSEFPPKQIEAVLEAFKIWRF